LIEFDENPVVNIRTSETDDNEKKLNCTTLQVRNVSEKILQK